MEFFFQRCTHMAMANPNLGVYQSQWWKSRCSIGFRYEISLNYSNHPPLQILLCTWGSFSIMTFFSLVKFDEFVQIFAETRQLSPDSLCKTSTSICHFCNFVTLYFCVSKLSLPSSNMLESSPPKKYKSIQSKSRSIKEIFSTRFTDLGFNG